MSNNFLIAAFNYLLYYDNYDGDYLKFNVIIPISYYYF